ncbi:MAG: DUF2029 domain-containing protein [Chloroflexi bacterium]|nr:DUF2029 domain-containing protein [Chloroflexota bacterium]
MMKFYDASYLRQQWSGSKVFRRVLIVSVIYFVLRLLLQVMLLAGSLYEGETEDGFYPADLQIYLDAAEHLANGEHLYLQGSLERLEEHYPYAPPFALAFRPFLWISPNATAFLHTALHVVAYALLYLWWDRIFTHLKLDRARALLAWTLPVWIVFSPFWGDLNYLNIYIPMALLGTLFLEAVIRERLGWSVLWLAIILQIKPHWAFAAAVPLLLGHYRFFLRLLGWTAVAYVATAGATLLIVGPEYGWDQYGEYVRFLGRLRNDFPWRGTDDGFLGYNHSITQIVVYILGTSAATLRLATVVKLLLLIPLVVVAIRYLRRPGLHAGLEAERLGVEWAFVLYLGAFIWLDMVWETSLGIAIFVYLLAVLDGRQARRWVWIVFLPYALLDLWQMLSYLALGDAGLIDDAYVATDPSIYLPMIMFVILLFYGLLLRRLWQAAEVTAPAPEPRVETAGQQAR